MKEKIKEYFRVIRENLYSTAKNNDILFEPCDYSQWNTRLKIRSNNTRAIFESNENVIKKIRDILNNELDDEIAGAMYDGVKELKSEELHDSSLVIEIMKKLITYYEAKNDVARLLFLYINVAYEELEFYLRMDKDEMAEEVRDYLLKTVSLHNQYFKVNAEHRYVFYIAYYNLVASLPDIKNEYKKDTLKYYKAAIELFNRPDIQAVDKDNERILDELEYLNEVFIMDFVYYLKYNSENADEYFKLVDNIKDDFDEYSVEYQLSSIAKDLYKEIITYNEAVEKLLALYDEYVKKNLVYTDEDSIFEYGNMSDVAYAIFELIKYTDYSKEKKYETVQNIIKPLLSFVSTVSFKDYPSYFDDVTTEMFQTALPYAKDITEKEKLIMKLLIQRQPITYIHSLMVQTIANTIVEEILAKDLYLKSELYKLGFSSDTEVKSYIARAAILHDLGKCMTVGVINQQARKLTDLEFKYIKMHPKKAMELINNDPDLEAYADIMIGHHKWYNGQGGYPIDFDNTKSKYKLIIDIITIADCMDAATDILGRNYTTGKSFYRVLDEFRTDAGVRYNPDIVEFIDNNEALKAKLSTITTEGRNKIYYDAYEEIILRETAKK